MAFCAIFSFTFLSFSAARAIDSGYSLTKSLALHNLSGIAVQAQAAKPAGGQTEMHFLA